MIKRDISPLTSSQILDILCPNRSDMLEKYRHSYDEMLKAQADSGDKKNGGAYAQYAGMAATLKKEAGEQDP